MSLYFYTNMAGQRFPLPERPLEPPDCFEEAVEPNQEEYCKEED